MEEALACVEMPCAGFRETGPPTLPEMEAPAAASELIGEPWPCPAANDEGTTSSLCRGDLRPPGTRPAGIPAPLNRVFIILEDEEKARHLLPIDPARLPDSAAVTLGDALLSPTAAAIRFPSPSLFFLLSVDHQCASLRGYHQCTHDD